MYSDKEYESFFRQVRLKKSTHKRIVALAKPTDRLDDVITRLLDIAAPILAEQRRKELLIA